MTKFATTNVRLPEDSLQELKLRAFMEKKSMAELMRRAIAIYLGHEEAKQKKKNRKAWKNDPMFNIIGIYSDPGMTDGSIRHDEVIYGDMMKKKTHPKK